MKLTTTFKALLLNALLVFSTSAFSQLPTVNEIRNTNDVRKMPSTWFSVKGLLGYLKKNQASGEVAFKIGNNGRKDTVLLLGTNVAPQPNVVRYDIARLTELLQACMDNGDTQIWFYVTGMSAWDVERYVQNHSDTYFSDEDKVQLLQKKTILIRVSGSALSGSGAELSTAGGGTSKLVDMGKLCPPPVDCN